MSKQISISFKLSSSLLGASAINETQEFCISDFQTDNLFSALAYFCHKIWRDPGIVMAVCTAKSVDMTIHNLSSASSGSRAVAMRPTPGPVKNVHRRMPFSFDIS